eukprot:148127-Pyramimonas_sp.AAC.1
MKPPRERAHCAIWITPSVQALELGAEPAEHARGRSGGRSALTEVQINYLKRTVTHKRLQLRQGPNEAGPW